MSLFDVIRYPVSDLPTKEQLSAIPMPILAEWGDITFWFKTTFDSEYIAKWYSSSRERNDGNANTISDIKEINILRRLIKEYEAPY